MKFKEHFKKIPVGILIFLVFAVAGVGTAKMLSVREDSKVGDFKDDTSIRVDSLDNKDSSVTSKSKSFDDSRNDSVRISNEDSKHKSGDNEDEEISKSLRESDDDEWEDDFDDDFWSSTQSNQSQNTTSGATNQSSNNSSATATFTLAQVATHNTSASCYSAISGSVYDLTSWVNAHPGGSSAIISLCGKDGTASFNAQHGGQGNPAKELASFKIGVLTQ